MTAVRLEAVFRKDMETKYGIKPKLSVKTDKHGDKWISTFKVAGTEGWEKGMDVTMDIIEKGDFINFVPTGVSSSAQASPDVNARLTKLESAVFGSTAQQKSPEEPVISADDLPDMSEEDGDGF